MCICFFVRTGTGLTVVNPSSAIAKIVFSCSSGSFSFGSNLPFHSSSRVGALGGGRVLRSGTVFFRRSRGTESFLSSEWELPQEDFEDSEDVCDGVSG